MTLALAVTVAALYTVGTYLVLQRTLTRIILGVAVLGHGANLLLLLSGGRAGAPPLVTGQSASPPGVADPLPQAFLLALAYRSWTLSRADLVENDVEDRRIAGLAGAGSEEGEAA
jgi:multicomponent Na+:H+ antiporter subunit C